MENRKQIPYLDKSYSDKRRILREYSLKDEIRYLKKGLSPGLLILGHHYQREEIIEMADLVGDSYSLAKAAAERKDIKNIVFCGVRFMAESAAILSREGQRVFHPDETAGCPLADMADLETVKRAWEEIKEVSGKSKIIPVTYINSSAEIKAFSGKNSGIICTSSTAGRAFDWAFSRGDKLFFFPDRHLGRNTALDKGIEPDEILLWNPENQLGGHSKDEIKNAKVILWNGFCHVHTFFTVDDVTSVRKNYPGVKVIVHPECTRPVVEASDEAGSTSYIVDYVKKEKAGSVIAVGTEINLVSRIAKMNPDKKIIELKRSLCPNMFKITLDKLAFVLKNIKSFKPVEVEDSVRNDARLALQRMLEV